MPRVLRVTQLIVARHVLANGAQEHLIVGILARIACDNDRVLAATGGPSYMIHGGDDWC